MEVLERAAGARGQLLRAEVEPAGPSGDEIAALVLTFDVGRVVLRADPAAGSVVETHLQAGDTSSPDWVVADEEEPWWRVLGSPLTRVIDINPGSGSVGFALQFRPDEDNPRRIAVMAVGGNLVVQLQKPGS